MAKKNARNTRGKIVNAAWQLFYEQGYEDTTVEEIIELSHTSKGSFYHYFDGKDALLSTLSLLFDEKYEELMDTLTPSTSPISLPGRISVKMWLRPCLSWKEKAPRPESTRAISPRSPPLKMQPPAGSFAHRPQVLNRRTISGSAGA